MLASKPKSSRTPLDEPVAQNVQSPSKQSAPFGTGSSTFSTTEKEPEKPLIASEYMDKSSTVEQSPKLESNISPSIEHSIERSDVGNIGIGGLSPPNIDNYKDGVTVN